MHQKRVVRLIKINKQPIKDQIQEGSLIDKVKMRSAVFAILVVIGLFVCSVQCGYTAVCVPHASGNCVYEVTYTHTSPCPR